MTDEAKIPYPAKLIYPTEQGKPGDTAKVCAEITWGEDLPIAAVNIAAMDDIADQIALDLLARGYVATPARAGLFLSEDHEPMVWVTHFCFEATICKKGEA